MRWLLHGVMTTAVREALQRHGHEARGMAEVNLPQEAALTDVLKAARSVQLEIMTTDSALAEAPFQLGYPLGRTMVLLLVGPGDVEQDDAVDRLFERYKRLAPGRLYTVTESRVKVRQLPTGSPGR